MWRNTIDHLLKFFKEMRSTIKFTAFYFGSMVVLWVLNSVVIEFTNFSLEFKGQIVPEIISSVFGVSAGLLALMGLVAIFISINSQHKIQKCRELYWQMIDNSYNVESIFDVATNLKSLILNYKKIFDQDELILNSVIMISKLSLSLVLVMWGLFSPLVDYNFQAKLALLFYITLGGFILIFFYQVIGKLGNFMELGKLTPPDEILSMVDTNQSRSKLLDLIKEEYYPDFKQLKFKLTENKHPNEIRSTLLAANYLMIELKNKYFKTFFLDRLKMLLLFKQNELDELYETAINLRLLVPLNNIAIKVKAITFLSEQAESNWKNEGNNFTIIEELKNENEHFTTMIQNWSNNGSYYRDLTLGLIKYNADKDSVINIDADKRLIRIPYGLRQYTIKLELIVDSKYDLEMKQTLMEHIDENFGLKLYEDLLKGMSETARKEVNEDNVRSYLLTDIKEKTKSAAVENYSLNEIILRYEITVNEHSNVPHQLATECVFFHEGKWITVSRF